LLNGLPNIPYDETEKSASERGRKGGAMDVHPTRETKKEMPTSVCVANSYSCWFGRVQKTQGEGGGEEKRKDRSFSTSEKRKSPHLSKRKN